MFDDIDPRSPTPLYEQIGVCVRMALATGELAPGDTLPSVRQLSGSLRINPATVSQAYRELARAGFVEMRHGSGTFVREITPARREEERWLRTRELARELLSEAARLGVAAEDLVRILRVEAGLTADGVGGGNRAPAGDRDEVPAADRSEVPADAGSGPGTAAPPGAPSHAESEFTTPAEVVE